MSAPLDEVIENVPHKLIDMNEALRIVKGKVTFTRGLIESMKTRPVAAPDPSLQPDRDKAWESNIALLKQQTSDGHKVVTVIGNFVRHQAAALMVQNASLLADILAHCAKLSAICREGKDFLDSLEPKKESAPAIDPLEEALARWRVHPKREDSRN